MLINGLSDCHAVFVFMHISPISWILHTKEVSCFTFLYLSASLFLLFSALVLVSLCIRLATHLNASSGYLTIYALWRHVANKSNISRSHRALQILVESTSHSTCSWRMKTQSTALSKPPKPHITHLCRDDHCRAISSLSYERMLIIIIMTEAYCFIVL